MRQGLIPGGRRPGVRTVDDGYALLEHGDVLGDLHHLDLGPGSKGVEGGRVALRWREEGGATPLVPERPWESRSNAVCVTGASTRRSTTVIFSSRTTFPTGGLWLVG